MLTDSFSCFCTSKEGTYYHQFGKMCRVRFPIFLEVLMLKIRITYSCFIKFLVNIWNHRKKVQDLRCQTLCKNLSDYLINSLKHIISWMHCKRYTILSSRRASLIIPKFDPLYNFYLYGIWCKRLFFEKVVSFSW